MDESRPDPSKPDASRARGMRFFRSTDASLLGLGTQMLSEVAAGVLLGLGADYLAGTKNRWVVVGSIAGVVVAMWTVIRVAMRLQTPRREPPRQKGGEP
ncbi:MAG: AtpZ/AtpI family protein [Phycisphaerales bacterium]